MTTITRSVRKRAADRRVRGDERGAAMIEFALALPFMMLMAMGIVEMSMGWLASTDLNSSVRDAARSGTATPSYATSDQVILQTLASSLSSAELNNVYQVIVFISSKAQGTPTTACLNSYKPLSPAVSTDTSAKGQVNICNVYSNTQLKASIGLATPPVTPDWSRTTSSGSTTCSGSSWDTKWCPLKRNNSLIGANLDYVGVWVKMRHASVTNFGFGDMTITRQAVFRIEPAFGGI